MSKYWRFIKTVRTTSLADRRLPIWPRFGQNDGQSPGEKICQIVLAGV
jgi:hypothetical protein